MPGDGKHRSRRGAEGKKEMNCCESQIFPDGMQRADSTCVGVSCQGQSHPVTLRTMLLMLKPEFFDRVGDRQYRFCASPDCSVAYFSNDRRFTTSDLRIRVGLKAKDDPIPLCYCLGFSEEDARQEIALKGSTTICHRIKSLLKEGRCACEESNPSGACCLGDVALAVKRLMQETR